ncbi:MAG: efflux RND transporter periplasmic adaptor subunit [Betaproteobacteria bacterium]|nr:efflux RND transporter periplasmic adaptor subunit [Betaproteobacteria bacterium]
MVASKKILVTVVSVLALGALGTYAYYANRSPLAPQPAGGRPPGGAPATTGSPGGFAIPVETAKVALETLQEDVKAVGSLRSNESVVVRPEISGRISAINFIEGARLSKGAALVALDSSTQAAEVQQARANLALAQSNFERTQELEKSKFVSASARDQALNGLKVTQANLALAEARLAKTQILAPFDATIGLRQVSVGDYVKEGQDLVSLEDMSALKLDFRLPENYFGKVKLGQQVEIKTDAFPGQAFKARLIAIDPLIDQAGRSLSLRARLDNPEGKLRPGMFANVRLILSEHASAMTIPEEALVPVSTNQFVFKVVDGKAQRVQVRIGLRRDAKVEVTEGLRLGDEVVTAGQMKIRDGAAVKAIASDPTPGATGASGRAGTGAAAGGLPIKPGA